MSYFGCGAADGAAPQGPIVSHLTMPGGNNRVGRTLFGLAVGA
jgi:hypothetical protein